MLTCRHIQRKGGKGHGTDRVRRSCLMYFETSDGMADWDRTSRGDQHLSSPTCGAARRNVKAWVGRGCIHVHRERSAKYTVLFLNNEGRDPDETRGEDSMTA